MRLDRKFLDSLSRVEQVDSPRFAVKGTKCARPCQIRTADSALILPCQSANHAICPSCAELWRYARVLLEAEAVEKAPIALAFTLTAPALWRKNKHNRDCWNDYCRNLFSNALKTLRRKLKSVEFVINRETSFDGTRHFHGTLTITAPDGMSLQEVIELVESVFSSVRTGSGDGRFLFFGEHIVKEIVGREDAECWARYHNKRQDLSSPMALEPAPVKGAWSRSRGFSSMKLKDARKLLIARYFGSLK